MSIHPHDIIEEARSKNWCTMVQNAPDIGDLWAYLARCEYREGGAARREVCTGHMKEPLLAYGSEAWTDLQKAHLLTYHFLPQGDTTIVPLSENAKIYLDGWDTDTIYVSPEEVRSAVGMMNKKAAPGRDNISTEALASLPALYDELAAVFTDILKGGDIPRQMLEVDVVVLPKPNKTVTKTQQDWSCFI